jgi:7-carboxy-7-deazaguanine synthase
MLNVSELYKSIQGESSLAGAVCVFVRLHGCNLRCTYCDTVYAREGEPEVLSIDDIVSAVQAFSCSMVEITGGEPLIQKDTPALCKRLLNEGYTVLVETNGTQNIGRIPAGCVRIVDVKCPGSGAGGSFLAGNVQKLSSRDEIKFVVTGKQDFTWVLGFMRTHDLLKRCAVFISPAFGVVEPHRLAQWILESGQPVRMGLQVHKIIWGESARGV